ncbi:MAG: MFS transporter [Planctomycetes bacterium]|nr:MFS transporter [Planctomycetota bacterium]
MSSWQRTYWVVWVSNLVTAAGMMSFLPFFPSHLQHLGVEDTGQRALWAGLIFGGAPFAASLMTPLWGALGDRYGRRLMTVRAMLAITVFVGAMAWATTPWQLFVLRLCQGVFSGFVAPSITLVSVIAPVERQGLVAGSLQTAMSLGAVVGPLLGGLAGPALGLEPVFLAVAAASAVSAALVWFLAEENSEDRQRDDGTRRPLEVLAGSLRDLRAVLDHAGMRRALLLVFVMILGVGATNPLLELYVEELGEPLASTERVTGLLVSAMAVVNLVAMPAWGHYGDRAGHLKALALSGWLGCAALLANALSPDVWTLGAARVALGAAMAGSMPLAYGLAAAAIPVQRRGGALGAVFSARTLAIALSSWSGGALAGLVGIRGLFYGGAGILLVLLVALALRGDALSRARTSR